MCLLAFALEVHSDYPLVLIGNRDEFHERPADPAHWWRTPRILAGRDRRGGGGWLGMSRDGALATVTNYREPEVGRAGAPSRGRLVVDALSRDPTLFTEQLVRSASTFNGFNLLWGVPEAFYYLNNRGRQRPERLAAGMYGLSNGVLDTPWPKLLRARRALEREVAREGGPSEHGLFDILADRHEPPLEELPDTGIDPDWERLLATAFICNPAYGTRASTVIMVRRDGLVTFRERAFDPSGQSVSERLFRFYRTSAGS